MQFKLCWIWLQQLSAHASLATMAKTAHQNNSWFVNSEQNLLYSLTKVCYQTNKKPDLERITEMEKEEKLENWDTQSYFQPNKKSTLLSGLKLLTCNPMQAASCNFKNILEGYVSTNTGYRLPNVHTLHNQVHIVVGGAMGDVSSGSNDPIFPPHHPLWIVFMRNGFASSTRTLRFFQPTMHLSDTTKVTSLYTSCCVYLSTDV